MNFLVWVLTACVLFVPGYYLINNPNEELTPIALVLKDLLLFLLTVVGTFLSTNTLARKQANNRWVPQARSSCRTLLTLWADSRRLRREIANLCSTVTAELPEMEEKKFNGARTALTLQCKAGANRIDAIADYLTDAVADWESFIGANCEGDECEQIWKELTEHREHLKLQLAMSDSKEGCGQPVDDPGHSVLLNVDS